MTKTGFPRRELLPGASAVGQNAMAFGQHITTRGNSGLGEPDARMMLQPLEADRTLGLRWTGILIWTSGRSASVTSASHTLRKPSPSFPDDGQVTSRSFFVSSMKEKRRVKARTPSSNGPSPRRRVLDDGIAGHQNAIRNPPSFNKLSARVGCGRIQSIANGVRELRLISSGQGRRYPRCAVPLNVSTGSL